MSDHRFQWSGFGYAALDCIDGLLLVLLLLFLSSLPLLLLPLLLLLRMAQHLNVEHQMIHGASEHVTYRRDRTGRLLLRPLALQVQIPRLVSLCLVVCLHMGPGRFSVSFLHFSHVYSPVSSPVSCPPSPSCVVNFLIVLVLGVSLFRRVFLAAFLLCGLFCVLRGYHPLGRRVVCLRVGSSVIVFRLPPSPR